MAKRGRKPKATREKTFSDVCVKKELAEVKKETLPENVKTYGQAISSWGEKLGDANKKCR